MNSQQYQKALKLSYFTVFYNILEGVICVGLGWSTGSIALIGFGSDSFIESLSGSIMIWRFSGYKNISEEKEKRIEAKAKKLIGYTFFILAIYVLFESIKSLYFKEIPESTLPGIVMALLSLIIMPILYVQKNRLGKSMHSHSLVADSKQTLACTFMSISLLFGLALNYVLGIWWADAIAGIIIVGFLIKEGFHAMYEESLCC